MKYDFDTVVPRRGTNSYKWDSMPREDILPMWVADMNFVCLPTIQQAVIERVQHPAFGYFDPTPEYYGSLSLIHI